MCPFTFLPLSLFSRHRRSSKPDRKDCELEIIEKQVDKYRDVLDRMVKKLPAGSADIQERDKRIKKQSHFKIGQALEESSKELSNDMPLHQVLLNCGEFLFYKEMWRFVFSFIFEKIKSKA